MKQTTVSIDKFKKKKKISGGNNQQYKQNGENNSHKAFGIDLKIKYKNVFN